MGETADLSKQLAELRRLEQETLTELLETIDERSAELIADCQRHALTDLETLLRPDVDGGSRADT